jgi:predicted enzyme related to lactoylglutathione lyase
MDDSVAVSSPEGVAVSLHSGTQAADDGGPTREVAGPVTEVASIVVFTEQVEETVAFYRALGVPLEDEDHGEGDVHAAGEMAGVHVAVVAASATGGGTPWRSTGSTFIGFWVESLEATMAAVERLGAAVLLGHEQCPWGCRTVVADPDGRAVEVNQRRHCPAPAG